MVDGRHFCRFFQEPDLRYLVENIWNSQSVLSAHDDLFDLVLVRWNKYEEWSPWNCILLTKEEASAHAKLENVTEVLSYLLFHFMAVGFVVPVTVRSPSQGSKREEILLVPTASPKAAQCDATLSAVFKVSIRPKGFLKGLVSL